MSITLLALLAGFGFILAMQVYENSKPMLTGQATVIQRRVEVAKRPTFRNGYNYLITFRLSDGEEIELYATEYVYRQLAEGQTGQLTWQSDNFREFST